jgi:hypothetical protein
LHDSYLLGPPGSSNGSALQSVLNRPDGTHADGDTVILCQLHAMTVRRAHAQKYLMTFSKIYNRYSVRAQASLHQLGDMTFAMLERLDEGVHSKIEELIHSRGSVPGAEASISSRMSSTSEKRDANEPAGFTAAFTKLGRLFARTLVASDPAQISLVQENRVDIFNAFVKFVDTPSNSDDVIAHIKRMSKSVVRSTSWPRTTHRGQTLTRILTSRRTDSRKHHSRLQRSSHRNARNT